MKISLQEALVLLALTGPALAAPAANRSESNSTVLAQANSTLAQADSLAEDNADLDFVITGATALAYKNAGALDVVGGHGHHHISHENGKIVVTIPNKYLNNASQILDLVNNQVVGLGQLINALIGHHQLHKVSAAHAQHIVDHITEPAHALREILLAATHAVKHLGLKIKTPADLTETASDPSCDGVCLLLKANNIVTEITAFANVLADKVGLEQVSAVIKPVIDAAEGLVLQLDGDIPSTEAPAREHNAFTAPFHKLHDFIKEKLHRLAFKFAKHVAKKYLHHVSKHDDGRYCHDSICDAVAKDIERAKALEYDDSADDWEE